MVGAARRHGRLALAVRADGRRSVGRCVVRARRERRSLAITAAARASASAASASAASASAAAGFGFGEITITAISGSDLSLKTADGWTRTITVTADTTITRAGTTITVADLKVGDEIRFAQTRNADGTYTVTKIQLVIPSVAGQVTAVDGSTITVKRFDGTTQTIHVDASTTYTVAGVTSPDTGRHQGRCVHRRAGHAARRRIARRRGGPRRVREGLRATATGPGDPSKAAPSAAPSGTPG